MFRLLLPAVVGLVLGCGGDDGAQGVSCADPCSLVPMADAKRGTCTTVSRNIDQARCQAASAGACAADQERICSYLECLIAGPTCSAGLELMYVQMTMRCADIYNFVSPACQSALSGR